MINWLSIVVSDMKREDACDFWKTMCLCWRHYVDPKWAEKSMSGHSDPKDLKKIFYESVLYNVSQSHMVRSLSCTSYRKARVNKLDKPDFVILLNQPSLCYILYAYEMDSVM